MASATPEVLEREITPTLPAQAGGTVDRQVATARQYPRSITLFMQKAQELATLNAEIAGSCVYAIPRDGKMIEGPSARLAEIVAHAWGNLRIQAGTTEQDDRFITARGEAWDVESNVAIAFEVKRRITGKNHKTYSDDMVTVTGNAAASIALRNAVFKTVPSSFWKPIYAKCRQVIAGDAKTFHARRDEMIKQFGVMGVTPQQLCTLVDAKGPLDITLDHMVTLTGVFTAIKDGDTTIEDAFSGQPTIQQPQRKTETSNGPAGGARDAQRAASQSTGTAPTEPASAAAGVLIVDMERRRSQDGTKYWWIVMDDQERIAFLLEAGDTWQELYRVLLESKTQKRRVELDTERPEGAKHPNIIGATLIGSAA